MCVVRNLLLVVLFLTCASPAYSEPCCYECEACGEAYSQSSRTAHWSAYIPIALIVGAAIWFGAADGNCSGSSNSSNSKDGLGSLASRKRGSSYSSYSSSNSGSYHSHCQ